MRVLAVLAVLLIWSGFAIGSVALIGYLGVMAVTAVGRRSVAGLPEVPRRRPWRMGDKLLAAGAVAGATYGTVLAVWFTMSGESFVFAAGPALAFGFLAGASTVVARTVAG